MQSRLAIFHSKLEGLGIFGMDMMKGCFSTSFGTIPLRSRATVADVESSAFSDFALIVTL